MIVTYELKHNPKPRRPLTPEEIAAIEATPGRGHRLRRGLPRDDRGAAQAVQASASPQGGRRPGPKAWLTPSQAPFTGRFSFVSNSGKPAVLLLFFLFDHGRRRGPCKAARAKTAVCFVPLPEERGRFSHGCFFRPAVIYNIVRKYRTTATGG